MSGSGDHGPRPPLATGASRTLNQLLLLMSVSIRKSCNRANIITKNIWTAPDGGEQPLGGRRESESGGQGESECF